MISNYVVSILKPSSRSSYQSIRHAYVNCIQTCIDNEQLQNVKLLTILIMRSIRMLTVIIMSSIRMLTILIMSNIGM